MLSVPDIQAAHGFFDRRGGASTGLYDSLNCGPGSGDDAARVDENRRIVAERLSGRRDTRLLTAYQVHGHRAVFTRDAWDDSDRPKADAIVTDRPGLIIGVLSADCTPILFEDPVAGVIAAAHGGWRGATSGITTATLALMEAHGADRSRVQAAIGPTIAQTSYEVRDDMRSAAMSADPATQPYFAPNEAGNYQFDLPGYVAARLQADGVAGVWNTQIDTYRSPDHFSYRRATHAGESDYGRCLSAIMIKP